MKRRTLVKLGAFLLLGAAVNVAVAWGCAAWSRAGNGIESRAPTPAEREHWMARAPRGWYFIPQALVVNRGFGVIELEVGNPSWVKFDEPAEGEHGSRAGYGGVNFGQTPRGMGDDRMVAVESGWPLVSMRGECWIASSPQMQQNPGNTGIHCIQAVLIGQTPNGRFFGSPDIRFIPLGVLATGFAINTILYGAILWWSRPLFAAPFAVRRRLRLRRGLCPHCAYPIGTSNLCTECGKPVSPRETASRTC